MHPIHPLTQGGASPRPLPAHRRDIVAGVVRLLRSLAPTIRAGFAILGLGLVADVAYHATHELHPHTHSGGMNLPTGIHLLVATGMLITLAGIVAAGIRSSRIQRTRDKEA